MFYDERPENTLCRGPSNKVQLQSLFFTPCTTLITFDTARLAIRPRRSQKIKYVYEVLSLKTQCYVCEHRSQNVELDLLPRQPEANQCEWAEAPQERNQRCERMKFHPTARFCFDHVRQWRLWSLHQGKGQMIGTPLESVTAIRTAFGTFRVEGSTAALEKLCNAMEYNVVDHQG